MKVTALAVLALAALATTSFARPSPVSVGVGFGDQCWNDMLDFCIENPEIEDCEGLQCSCLIERYKVFCYENWDCQDQPGYEEAKKAEKELCA
ncbi:hypothetical protein GQ42DRAFT_160178 [Ramicandelaber brevisporus]|nr:hypothetical protein GQ42DRAFT_160178 [Ramicandelaber brevisporus]